MRTYQVRLKPTSPYLTPWRNCTLWGRLTWIIADGRLPQWNLRDWLEQYRSEQPPLVVSDAFPTDAVPLPALFHARYRGGEAPKTLSWDEWRQACTTGTLPKDTPERPRTTTVERTHVVMDRALGKSLDGGLRTERGWQPNELIVIALADDSLGKDGLEQLFSELCREGWGQGLSYGYGALSLSDIQEIDVSNSSPWRVTLGHCHPTDDLPAEGYWRWAGVPVRPHDPETRRGPTQLFTTMLLPGACFKTDKQVIGRTVALEGNDHYLHYGLTPTLPVTWKEENA